MDLVDAELRRIEGWLAHIEFAPSCVDMGWRWEVVAVEDVHTFALSGILIRTTFQRPDRDTGNVARGFGRWWHVPPGVTESGVVKTAYAAARMILEHELKESFRYQGARLFDPHHDIEDLRAAVASRGGRS